MMVGNTENDRGRTVLAEIETATFATLSAKQHQPFSKKGSTPHCGEDKGARSTEHDAAS